MISAPKNEIEITYEQISIICSRVALNDDIALELVQVPTGEFMMGSPNDEADRQDSEGPQHLVQVPGFWMGQYPVTQAEWQVVADFPQVNRELDSDPSVFKGDRRPVEFVSWYDAVEFCDRLTKHTGRVYRLPTEAEWEYACRAGTKTPFHFGQTISTDLGNYRGTKAYGAGTEGVYVEETTPVGSFNVYNLWGLSDMHGNVFEWCLDHWRDNYEAAPTDVRAWLSGDEDADRVLRGGSWDFDPWWCRSASRDHVFPGDGNDFIGFRVVSALRETP